MTNTARACGVNAIGVYVVNGSTASERLPRRMRVWSVARMDARRDGKHRWRRRRAPKLTNKRAALCGVVVVVVALCFAFSLRGVSTDVDRLGENMLHAKRAQHMDGFFFCLWWGGGVRGVELLVANVDMEKSKQRARGDVNYAQYVKTAGRKAIN